jgi:hypothetical protein
MHDLEWLSIGGEPKNFIQGPSTIDISAKETAQVMLESTER